MIGNGDFDSPVRMKIAGRDALGRSAIAQEHRLRNGEQSEQVPVFKRFEPWPKTGRPQERRQTRIKPKPTRPPTSPHGDSSDDEENLNEEIEG
jgi:hypothetical protein